MTSLFIAATGQNVGKTELLYTSLVCTGIGRSTLDVVVNFANVVSFTSMKLTNGFRLSVHDQDPFKLLYDAALKNILDPICIEHIDIKHFAFDILPAKG